MSDLLAFAASTRAILDLTTELEEAKAEINRLKQKRTWFKVSEVGWPKEGKAYIGKFKFNYMTRIAEFYFIKGEMYGYTDMPINVDDYELLEWMPIEFLNGE